MSGYEFYYDRVLANPYLTYRVIGQRFRSGLHTSDLENQESSQLLDPEVILTGVIRRPTQISVSHSYSYSGNTLTSIYENFMNWISTISVDLLKSAQSFQDLFDQFLEEQGGIQSSVVRGIQKLAPSDFYKVFQGTNVEVPLTFESRIYTTYNRDSKRYIPPYEILQKVNSYFLGTSVSGSNSEASMRIYTSPHGYSGIRGQGWNPTGALTIYIGRYIELRNLILTNYDISASRELLYLDGKVKGPLYIDITFTCIPAIVFTSKDVNEMVSGTYIQGGSRYEDTAKLEEATRRGERDKAR